jgi:hypothetical protein
MGQREKRVCIQHHGRSLRQVEQSFGKVASAFAAAETGTEDDGLRGSDSRS